MEPAFNYVLFWCLYVSAGLGFFGLVWWLTRSSSIKFFNYSIRAVMAAIVFTPWPANIHGDTLAPAIMVLTLDLITMSENAVARAAVPLILAIIVSELLAIGLYWKNRRAFSK